MDFTIILEILIIIFIWIIFVYYIGTKKYEKLKPYGPALMMSTERGRKTIERISKKKFWDYYGVSGIYITLIAMVFTFALLIWEAILVIGLPKSAAPNPLAIIGLPGINPYIPVSYGIIGLIIAVVIHEFSHGIQSARNSIKIKSLGILWFIIPVGAFVEPDEEQIEKSDKKIRMKIFAAGPTTNLIAMIIALLIFLLLMSNVSVAQEGVLVVNSYNKNIQPGDLITGIGNITLKNISGINNINLNPGENVQVKLIRNSHPVEINTISGVWVTEVLKNTPAYNSGIKPGFIFLKVNNMVIKNITFFYNFMDNATANERLNFIFLYNGNTIEKNVTLIDKYAFYQSYAPGYNSPSFKGKGFLGVTVMYMNISYSDPKNIISLVSNPFSSGPVTGMIDLIALPFMGLAPFPAYFQSVYSTPFSSWLFWPVVNIFYWIFWLNLMLGLTNVLPLMPLDGGYVFKDYISRILSKIRIKDPDKTAYFISIALSLAVVFLILWQFIYLDFL
ncbi:MAG: site-2 protease family protein [Thermoplasmata archaeon]|nr:site-2 protease family protein [Thermoplasmata archaeon]